MTWFQKPSGDRCTMRNHTSIAGESSMNGASAYTMQKWTIRSSLCCARTEWIPGSDSCKLWYGKEHQSSCELWERWENFFNNSHNLLSHVNLCLKPDSIIQEHWLGFCWTCVWNQIVSYKSTGWHQAADAQQNVMTPDCCWEGCIVVTMGYYMVIIIWLETLFCRM